MDHGIRLDWENDDLTAPTPFVGREDMKEILKESVLSPQLLSDYRTLMFYGAGGQGKSTLKNEYFINEFARTSKSSDLLVIDRFDFEANPACRAPETALLLIAKDLIEEGNIPLPAFSLGFFRYKGMTSPEANLKAMYPYLFRLDFIESDVACEYLETIVSASIEWGRKGLSELPGVGFFLQRITEKGYDKLVSWFQESRSQKVLADIDQLNSMSLLYRLPVLLAFDLHNYLKGKSQGYPIIPRKKIAIVFDGYETLWNDEKEHNAAKDWWVRKLVEQMPGVLFLIFGREKLPWKESNPAFETIITHHELKGLKDSDANVYLEQSGITDPTLRETIVKSAKSELTPEEGCLPFYLDLQVKTFREIIKNGGTPCAADFSGTENGVVEHFFNHIDKPHADALYFLSIAPYIDEEIMELFFENAHIPITVTFGHLSQYSFMTTSGGRANMHGLVREFAGKKIAATIGHRIEKIHRMLFGFFMSKMPPPGTKFYGDMDLMIGYASYYRELFDVKTYDQWAIGIAEDYPGDGVYGAIVQILVTAYNLNYAVLVGKLGKDEVGFSDFPDSDVLKTVKLYRLMGDKLLWNDKYKEAFEQYERCTALLDDAATRENFAGSGEIAAQRKSVLEMTGLVQEFRHNYKEAQICYFQARGFDVADADYHVAHSRFSIEFGYFMQAEPTLYPEYFRVKDELTNYAAYVTETLADNFLRQSRFEESIRFYKKALTIYGAVYGLGDPYYIQAKLSFAHALALQGDDFPLADSIFNEVEVSYSQLYEPDHLKFALLHKYRGVYYAMKGRTAAALDSFNKAISIYSQKVGPTCKEVIRVQALKLVFIDRLRNSGKLDQKIYDAIMQGFSSSLFENVMRFEKALGTFNPVFRNILDLAVDLAEVGSDRAAHEILARSQREVRRTFKNINNITEDGFTCEVLNGQQRDKAQRVLSTIMSFPSDESFTITKIDLPFYETYDLYKISYLGLPLESNRFVLSNGKVAAQIDYISIIFYTVGDRDKCIFTKENVILYLALFMDLVWSWVALFFVSRHENFPWCVDVPLTDEYKKRILLAIRPARVIEEDEDSITVEGYFLHGYNVLHNHVRIEKANGMISFKRQATLYHTRQMEFYVSFFDEATDRRCCFDPDGNEITEPTEGKTSEIMACRQIDDDAVVKRISDRYHAFYYDEREVFFGEDQ